MPTFRIECVQELRYVTYIKADTEAEARAKVEAEIEAEGELQDAMELDGTPFSIATVELTDDDDA